MEYNKIQERLEDFIVFYERSGQDSIKWNEYRNLEEVYKNNKLVEDLKARARYLHEWMYNIGKDVYISNKSSNYALVDTFSKMDSLNQSYFTTLNKYVFSEEMFHRLCVDYCSYQVKRLTEQLVEREITSNSTSKITNLDFEWNLECKQELIKMFKDLSEL